MRLSLVSYRNRRRVALYRGGRLFGLERDAEAPAATAIVDILTDPSRKAAILEMAEAGVLEELDQDEVVFLPPLPAPAKIICVGLNYRAHAKEAGLEPPKHPTFFARFASGLVGHREAILRPPCSAKLDYEGELAAVIGKPIRNASIDECLDAVVGYSIFNDATIRDYQLERGAQWTLGKNFDNTGGFGPSIVSADELPRGAAGLSIETRLNDEVVQIGTTSDLIFSVGELLCAATEAFALGPGDLLVTGTPPGVGHFRSPPLFMKPGDCVQVSIAQIGVLSNPVADANPSSNQGVSA